MHQETSGNGCSETDAITSIKWFQTNKLRTSLINDAIVFFASEIVFWKGPIWITKVEHKSQAVVSEENVEGACPKKDPYEA